MPHELVFVEGAMARAGLRDERIFDAARPEELFGPRARQDDFVLHWLHLSGSGGTLSQPARDSKQIPKQDRKLKKPATP
jgi:hypothetical protein